MTDSNKRNLINSTVLATPCPVSWGEMSGDQKQRFCAECKLHVYNISEMTEDEAGALLEENRGKDSVCLRFFRRADGTVLTKNCPVGLKKLKEQARRAAAWLAAGLSCLLSLAVNAKDGDASSDCDKSNKKLLFHGSIRAQQANTNKGAPAAATTPSPVRTDGAWLLGKPSMSLPTPAEISALQERFDTDQVKLGADNPALAPQLVQLGNKYRLIGEHNKSAECFKKAIAVLKKQSPVTSEHKQQLRTALYSYMTLCTVTGDKDGSARLHKQIKELDTEIAADRKAKAK